MVDRKDMRRVAIVCTALIVILLLIAFNHMMLPSQDVDGEGVVYKSFGFKDQPKEYTVSRLQMLDDGKIRGTVSIKGNPGYKNNVNVSVNYYVVSYNDKILKDGTVNIQFDTKEVKVWNIVTKQDNVKYILVTEGA